jgi:hypothetical protein
MGQALKDLTHFYLGQGVNTINIPHTRVSHCEHSEAISVLTLLIFRVPAIFSCGFFAANVSFSYGYKQFNY